MEITMITPRQMVSLMEEIEIRITTDHSFIKYLDTPEKVVYIEYDDPDLEWDDVRHLIFEVQPEGLWEISLGDIGEDPDEDISWDRAIYYIYGWLRGTFKL